MTKGEKVAFRAANNEIYAAFYVSSLELDHHPRKAHLIVLTENGIFHTVADYDPDLIELSRWTDMNVEGWLTE